MTVLLLEPHNDDAALFAASHVVALAALSEITVATVLRSYYQEARGLGITYAERETEEEKALAALGLPAERWEQWEFSDLDPPWPAIVGRIEAYARLRDYQRVLAPAPEPNRKGHPHHDRIGEIALDTFGPERVTFYLTYTQEGKSDWGVPVPPQPDWIIAKHRALACYRSQIVEWGCRPHFVRDICEYTAEPL